MTVNTHTRPAFPGRLSDEEALELYARASLPELGARAQELRYFWNPEPIVTYLVDRNINYTNVCNTDCMFCAFYRPSSKHPEAYVLTKEQLSKKVEELLELGGTRILLQGGHNDDLPYDYYLDLISWLSSTYPIELNAFSPSEIQQMQKISGKSYETILRELKDAGLRGLPGGGAELLDDVVRKRVSPKKTKADEWIEIMEVAQALDLTTTSTMVVGLNETPEQRLNHLRRLRDLQDRSQKRGHEGFNAFISWTLRYNENTSIGRSRHVDKFGASVVDYLRNMCIARIYLDNIPHHQSSWPTLGPEIAQIGLQLGCDDIGSTMMEENVVSQAGAPTKDRWSISPEELQEYIRGAGFIPAQRNTSYEILKVFSKDEPIAAAVA